MSFLDRISVTKKTRAMLGICAPHSGIRQRLLEKSRTLLDANAAFSFISSFDR